MKYYMTNVDYIGSDSHTVFQGPSLYEAVNAFKEEMRRFVERYKNGHRKGEIREESIYVISFDVEDPKDEDSVLAGYLEYENEHGGFDYIRIIETQSMERWYSYADEFGSLEEYALIETPTLSSPEDATYYAKVIDFEGYQYRLRWDLEDCVARNLIDPEDVKRAAELLSEGSAEWFEVVGKQLVLDLDAFYKGQEKKVQEIVYKHLILASVNPENGKIRIPPHAVVAKGKLKTIKEGDYTYITWEPGSIIYADVPSKFAEELHEGVTLR